MKIYFLSGLGADSRVFKFLKLPAEHELIFIDWLTPEKNETLNHYAGRISTIIDTSSPFILVGMSFGGILATEVLDYVHPVKTILISSAPNRDQLPVLYKWAGALRLNKLIPSRMGNKPNPFIYRMFGITEERDKKLLRDIITSTNTAFSKWAVNEIVNWKRLTSDPAIIRIHGTKDQVLPIIDFTPQYLIKDGGHFMIVNKADEISEILKKEIAIQS